MCSTDFFEELLVLGEIEQPYELIGPEPSLGLAADASQRLFDQGVIYRLQHHQPGPVPHHPPKKVDATKEILVVEFQKFDTTTTV